MNSDASPYLARFLATSRVALGLDMRPVTPHPDTATATDDPCAEAIRSCSQVDDSSSPRPRSRSVGARFSGTALRRHPLPPAPLT
ncbi:MAG: hypothetical protein QOK44_904 [Betaproteobacteria bacterium]|nr:hypothetical protein [Betaproteobacteria bacterium]